MLPWSPQLFLICHHPVSPWRITVSSKWTRPQDLLLCFLMSHAPPHPHPKEMRWAAGGGHLSPLLKLFPGWNLIGGKVPISLCTCKISCATSITLFISYATAIRSEWSVGLSFATFRWGYHFIYLFFSLFSEARAWPGSGKWGKGGFFVSVGFSPGSVDRNQRGQLPMSERPSTHEMANRHTHGCLLALARVTVFPPTALHGHALPRQTGSDAQPQVDRNQISWTKKKKKKILLKVFNKSCFLTSCLHSCYSNISPIVSFLPFCLLPVLCSHVFRSSICSDAKSSAQVLYDHLLCSPYDERTRDHAPCCSFLKWC